MATFNYLSMFNLKARELKFTGKYGFHARNQRQKFSCCFVCFLLLKFLVRLLPWQAKVVFLQCLHGFDTLHYVRISYINIFLYCPTAIRET